MISDTAIKDKQGRLLTTEKDQEVCWVEHVKEVFNTQPPTAEAKHTYWMRTQTHLAHRKFLLQLRTCTMVLRYRFRLEE